MRTVLPRSIDHVMIVGDIATAFHRYMKS